MGKSPDSSLPTLTVMMQFYLFYILGVLCNILFVKRGFLAFKWNKIRKLVLWGSVPKSEKSTFKGRENMQKIKMSVNKDHRANLFMLKKKTKQFFKWQREFCASD